MISEAMVQALNVQVNKEMFSSYLYLSMSAFAASEGYKGAANWFRFQAQEETSHAMKFFNYIESQGARPVLKAIEEPAARFDSYQDLFEKALAHEQFITKSINELADLARNEKDHATEIFLQWFVTEQIEEEENVNEILDTLRMIGPQGNLYMLDRELNQRQASAGVEDGE